MTLANKLNKSPRDSSIGAQLAILHHLLRRKNQSSLKESDIDITIEQLVVLEVLNIHGQITMSQLSHIAWKQNANITRIVDKLEKKGMVQRKALEHDKRTFLISMTTLGKEIFVQAIPILISNYKNTISCITKEEEEITLRTLKKLIAFHSK